MCTGGGDDTTAGDGLLVLLLVAMVLLVGAVCRCGGWPGAATTVGDMLPTTIVNCYTHTARVSDSSFFCSNRRESVV